MSDKGLTIRKIEVRILNLPTIREHKMAMTTMTSQRTVLLKIITDNGLYGLGEASNIGGLAYIDESPESIQLTLCKYFAPLLEGQNAADYEQITAQYNSTIRGNYFAKNAVESALLDIMGKHLGQPVSELLGGRQRDQLEVIWVLASGDTDRDIAEAHEKLAARKHRHFKLKIGKRDWREDVAHVAAIKQALGDEASIRVDVNQAWDLETAKLAVPALSEVGVSMIEQPLESYDECGSASLRNPNGAAIMADEGLRGGGPIAERWIKGGACDAFALKPAQAGGLRECGHVARLGLAAGLDLYGGTMLECGVGTAASAQLFATLPEMKFATELFGPLLLTREVLSTPLVYENFHLQVPNTPGIGIDVDMAAIKDVTEDCQNVEL